MKTGDAVKVNMGRRGGIQSGTVVSVNTDGSFVWANGANYKRTAKPSQITTESTKAGQPDAYIAAWFSEEE